MLRTLSREDARTLRDFLHDSKFVQAEIQEQLATSELQSERLDNEPYLLHRTRLATPLHVLLRLFLLNATVEPAAVDAVLPAQVLRILLESGLLLPGYRSEYALAAFEHLLIASDPISKSGQSRHDDLVLWPNPTTLALWRFTIQQPFESVLDLGTGCGVQALMAAPRSTNVLATDLNPRAIEITRFNAWLNGIENVECVAGDAYEPAGDRTFDLIVSNPPFFVSPRSNTMFCENPMDLDQFCRKMIREGAGKLNEGGFLQMICEWVQVEGQPWKDRVAEWVQHSGCDAWIIKGYTEEPAQYARKRMREIDSTAAGFDAWMQYYADRKVEAIHGGMITLHRRSAPKHWLKIDEAMYSPQAPFGDTVEQFFEAQDFLHSRSPEWDLLSWAPRLIDDVRLEQTLVVEDGTWHVSSLRLVMTGGLPLTINVQPAVADFLAQCDGSHTFRELVEQLSKRVKAPPEQVGKECWSVVRRLMEAGFISP